MKLRPAAFIALLVVAALSVTTYVRFFPCDGVKNGIVELINSPACIKECAVDGGDCPYTPKSRTNQPPLPQR